MIEHLSTVVTGVKTATDIVKTILEINKDKKIEDKAIELRNVIISLQNNLLQVQLDQQSLMESNNTLERKLVEYESWDAERRNYELKEVSKGVFVYASKPAGEKTDPSHWLCQNCFHKREKSILQLRVQNELGSWYVCHNCDKEIDLPS